MSLPDQLDRFADQLRALPDAAADIGSDLLIRGALRASHGPFATKALRKMYNPKGPYSKADPHPPLDPSIVNEQTGNFARNWNQRKTRTADQIKVSTWNSAAYAGALESSPNGPAIDRPLPQLVVRSTFPLLAQRLVTKVAALP